VIVLLTPPPATPGDNRGQTAPREGLTGMESHCMTNGSQPNTCPALKWR
jgi:hypothetical protein